MRIAFLGLGKMGEPIVRLLLKHGNPVTVWNRTAARAEALEKEGATVARSAEEAAVDADIVFTMVMDDASLEEVLYQGGVLKAMCEGAIHVSLSTISVALSKKLTEEHAWRGQHFVGAPVFGRPNVAQEGRLWIAVGGKPEPVAKIRPVLEQFSRGVSVVSEQPWSAHAMKLGGNFLITAMIASLTEGMVYAEAMGIDPAVFVETVNSALFQSPFYRAYGEIMLHPPEQAGGTIAVGEKDARLFCDSAKSAEIATPLADIFTANLQKAIELGMKDADWAGGYYRLAGEAMRKPR
ncbi:NAD(P)-dependent oxidoreductase [Paracidobacterium acidisoli]|uniref:NAD(P)-dependent oxidoreductase n=1 Tax=Paracidobacterium acidisoli TaxID=2303751 RepID=A0A372IQD3_9BACT|nr:NAD(P)-dependent oxidoreductase [Paracidobacterium acidisoli]MBT9331445.1 NAD(P)-dependent oxidoreductase [Paracidobacterium acidisoli]